MSKLDDYMNKYFTVEDLLRNASQYEKDEFLLLRRKAEVSYDENPLGDQHSLDAFLRMASMGENNYAFDNRHSYFSIHSLVPFEGQTNLFFPKQYTGDTFPPELRFISISQYFQFHSAMLFLDRNLSHNVIRGKTDDFLNLGKSIQNFDELVWKRYRIFIMQQGVNSLYRSNEQFRTQLINTSNQLMVYHSSLSYWSMGTTGLDQNYWGKILTRTKLIHRTTAP